MATKRSIKTRLIIVPILLVTITLALIAGISSNLSKKELLSQMKEDGFKITRQVVKRLEENKRATDVLKGEKTEFSYQSLVSDLGKEEGIVYALFIDDTFKAVAHSREDRIGLDLSNDPGTKAALSGQTYASEYYYEPEKTKVYDILMPFEFNGKVIGAINIGISMESVYSAVNKTIMTVVISGIISFIFLAAILFSTSNYAVGTLIRLKAYLGSMENGDFSEDIPEDLMKKDDEFGDISKAIKSMQNSIRSMIGSIAVTSEQLASSSEELTATSQDTSRAAEEIGKTVEEISKGAIEQAKDTSEGVSFIRDLGELIEKDRKLVQKLNLSADGVINLKEEGEEAVFDLVEKTEESRKATVEIKEVISSTNESAEKIENASLMIKNIADQTNLLALNAAIEAARAGDSGRGFAVVAEEIRKLAEQSNNFTEEIASIVKDLTSKTENAVTTMDYVEEIAHSQAESVNHTKDKFRGIADSIEIMKEVIKDINDSGRLMGEKKEELVRIIESLSAISEENAAGTEQVVHSVEQQNEAMIEIIKSSDQLTALAEEMRDGISAFKY